ncbi:MAG TPA: undecaprenyldiphospho-muramoylpentapeptide beta-N-acetylglucosaminyltransferase [Verrucomicrobiae bacterium]|nr:undecaprenyldiphospho-muramoylpentapeptide beta-N-acetylglucosaminyltransferase [Verrucomicrobiae bacterium]
MNAAAKRHVVIACGGTGGHLFPGLAVAEQLSARDCSVTLLISPKEVDQRAVQQAHGMEVVTLPAVGLTQGRRLAFLRGFVQSYRASRKLFRARRVDAALAMGGFTSAPPILAAKRAGARTFLHESNTIPGRANRWLSRAVHQAFVGFPQTAERLRTRLITTTGTPVRPAFENLNPTTCRTALNLDPDHPVLVVTGGSQGASGVNELVLNALPLLERALPKLQLFWLAGTHDFDRVEKACARGGMKSIVHAFFADMHLALGAASAVVSRAGASSLAELAAVRLPAILVPYPAATDNHQLHNALAFVETGAARLMEQKTATPEQLVTLAEELVSNERSRSTIQASLEKWQSPDAAGRIAETMLSEVQREHDRIAATNAGHCCSCGHDHHARTMESAG